MRYETNIKLAKNYVDRLNALLSIENMEEMTDSELSEVGANTYDCIPLYDVTFENGASLYVDVCPGDNNYYDDCVWRSPDCSKYISLDCEYEIDDIEVCIDGDIYIVKIIFEEE